MSDKIFTKLGVSYRDGGATLKRLQKELPTASGDRKDEIERDMKLFKNEAWIIIYGKIYDVSKFLVDHPGGPESLLGCAGKDATVDFEDIYHSPSAREQVLEMYVGKIDDFDFPEDAITNPPKGPESAGNIGVTLLPLIAAAAAVVYYVVYKL